MNTKIVTLKGKIFSSVENINGFILSKAKGFVREDVNDDVEISALILPYATKMEFVKGSGSWQIFVFEDKYEEIKTQKMIVIGQKEGSFLEVGIPIDSNIEKWILSYDGETVRFTKKNEFGEKKFLEKSSEIIKKNVEKRLTEKEIRAKAAAEERAKTAAEAKEKARDEAREKQNKGVKPKALDLDAIPDTPVSFKPREKKDSETYRPFAGLVNKA